MEVLSSLPSWRNIAVAATVYFASLAFYRLFLHPLSRFPGPKLAAITRYYEAYYDMIQGGQYIFKIAEMHKKYGPIIRISPYELHVNDPSFFEKLYRQEGRWDKYAWAQDAFMVKGAVLCTPDHDLHKARRLPLNPFFSKAKVVGKQDLIRHNISKLCSRISKATTIDLGAATSAFTRDVSTQFILGKNYHNLDSEDFNVGMTNSGRAGGAVWQITKHVRWFGPTMKSIPLDLMIKVVDEDTKSFFRYMKQSEEDTKDLLAEASSAQDDKGFRTIVHEIVDSNLPPAEKGFGRVVDDVMTVTGAGFETTANVLRLVFYHVFSNASILQRLRAELASAGGPPQSSAQIEVELRTLEQLPYLTSILMEGMRLSPAIASRMTRIAPDRDIVYGEWNIPAGTPVGMTTLLMHTDEKLYPEPLHFKPERWLDLNARKKADKAYMPFSRGTRNCLGMHLAWAEMYLVLAALVERFNFQFEDISAEDFECNSDQFVIGTRGKGILKALVSPHKG